MQRRSVPSVITRLPVTTLALAMAFMMAAPAKAEPPLPNGSSGRVHYDHYRDRGERDRDWGRHHRHKDHRHHSKRRHHDHDDNRSSTVIRERSGGTYSGSISGYRDRGNGTYFHVENDGRPDASRGPLDRNRAGPKVIRPGAGSACSNEGGVCVIRPGR